ncbi:hypothetical protein D1AOALGA4SA_9013 [Olavius algarvensis Delta 1 endosymbiont]|nr:hypothetical protein D1AOALGA4SA_9013 [Olavius algarvensis Delta 1 endosymbiont]
MATVTNTVSTAEEYVPGIREQAKGIKINSESLFRPLKACITGTPDQIYLPDPDRIVAMGNLLKGNSDENLLNYLRKHADKNLKDADPEMYEKCRADSDALAKAYRDHGVKVIRNESGIVPEELIEWQTGWGGPKYLSLFASGAGEVLGNIFVNTHEIFPNFTELAHRDAFREIFKNDPDAVWLTMPQLYPSSVHPTCWPYTSPADFRVFPDKLCFICIGVAEESHIHDRSQPRSSGEEEGFEILRRMLKPYGWRLVPLYFNSKYTYHIDCGIGPVAEGVIGIPTGGPGPFLWQGLPDELKDWEVIDVPWEDHKELACNCVVVDEKKVVIPEKAVNFAEEIAKRGYEPVPVPYHNITEMTGSGIQCSTMILEREDS